MTEAATLQDSVQSIGDDHDPLSTVLGDEETAPDVCEGGVDKLLSGTGESFYGAEGILETCEESAPIIETDYLSVLLRTDPRAAFDLIHNGALRVIERSESRSLLHSSLPTGRSRTSTLTANATIVANIRGEKAFLLPAVHPIISARPAIEREEERADMIISNSSKHEVLLEALGPDLVTTLKRERLSGGAFADPQGLKRRRAA